jgi:hypothetical protein
MIARSPWTRCTTVKMRPPAAWMARKVRVRLGSGSGSVQSGVVTVSRTQAGAMPRSARRLVAWRVSSTITAFVGLRRGWAVMHRAVGFGHLGGEAVDHGKRARPGRAWRRARFGQGAVLAVLAMLAAKGRLRVAPRGCALPRAEAARGAWWWRRPGRRNGVAAELKNMVEGEMWVDLIRDCAFGLELTPWLRERWLARPRAVTGSAIEHRFGMRRPAPSAPAACGPRMAKGGAGYLLKSFRS